MIIIITLLVLGLIIFLHELGHFYTAKKYNMPVSEFSIGMGPLIYSTKYNGTQYSIRAIPIGGYVSIEGMLEISKDDKEFSHMSDEEIKIYNERGFNSKSKLKRLVVLLAGIFMNFLTAIIALFILGLVNKANLIEAFNFSIKVFIFVFVNTLESLKNLITGVVSVKNLVGPIGLPALVRVAVNEAGYISLLNIFALLSINIGILNLLPIPALDGGRVIFIIMEALGIKVNKKIEEKLQIFSMILLLGLMVFVFYNDILRLIK